MAHTIGHHAIEELLRSLPRPSSGTKLFVSSSSPRVSRLIDLATRRGVRIARVNRDVLDRLSEGADHRGAVLAIETLRPDDEATSSSAKVDSAPTLEEVVARGKANSLLLFLDHITDPHNLGAILRSADQFSADLVVIPARRSAGLNQTVAKTSAGASAYVPTHVATNLARALDLVKGAGYWVYGAESEGTAAFSLDLVGKIALVVGSEGKGISSLVRSKCDGLVGIPTTGRVDSLNVSVATGILLYEIRRQQELRSGDQP